MWPERRILTLATAVAAAIAISLNAPVAFADAAEDCGKDSGEAAIAACSEAPMPGRIAPRLRLTALARQVDLPPHRNPLKSIAGNSAVRRPTSEIAGP